MNKASLPAEWSAPQVYKVDNEAELLDFVKFGNVVNVIDPVQDIAEDLFELHHPELMHDKDEKTKFVSDIEHEGPSFGRWVHYPWINALVRVAEPDDHYNMRTYRNRNLITKEQQDVLRDKKIAAFGLSVGSNVVDRTVQSGIGNEYLLFDFDRLSPANLNRIQASLAQIGLLKTTIAGRKMAELDPYITQQHFTGGYDRNSDDILRANRPDVIIEEVDNLEVKARLRNIAKELGVPLVMAGDVGDRTTLDIERHDDTENSVEPFNGKLTEEEAAMLAAGTPLSPEQELGMTIKMLGKENISEALYMSAMLKGKELAGLPQLGTTATIGGALTSVAIRDIFLGRNTTSGAYVIDAAVSAGSTPIKMIQE